MDSPADMRELMERAKAGDKIAFGVLYEECYVPVYRYVYARFRNKEQAEDVTQDSFMKAFAAMKTFAPSSGSFLPYLYTIARNASIDAMRKQVPLTHDSSVFDTVPSSEPTPEAAAIIGEESGYIIQCLDELPPEQHQMIAMKFLSGLTNKEIETMTGKNQLAIRQLQSRGLKTLATTFKKKHELS